MKLATRISSIRRQAWKQCRSCSEASLSMWADSPARNPLAGWMRSPRAASTWVAGVRARRARGRRGGGGGGGEPVDLESGVKLAQLVGDRDVALGVAEADRRRD